MKKIIAGVALASVATVGGLLFKRHRAKRNAEKVAGDAAQAVADAIGSIGQ